MSALARQRQEVILERIRREGGVRVSELVDTLGVSDMTVRRDIAQLADRGLVVRVHGGATLSDAPHSSFEPAFRTKLGEEREEKLAIARAAAALVAPGSSVALSAGTTTLALAEELRDVEDLTVVTNSVPVADALFDPDRRDRTVVLTGGTRTPSDALVGPVAVQALRDLHVDLLFLGVHGFSERTGCTSPNMTEAATNRALIAAAGKTVVVADHTKLRLVGLATIVGLDDVDVLVCDHGLPEDDRAMLASHVGRLLVATPHGPTHHDGPREGHPGKEPVR
ncbi:DeoR/GlpR family DNA-binding transcription regulator [Aquipuribacter hungaricus]|uniref:DeoR/GlpR family DNA-binding transcription regulator n=1 Tax=Aquipuribacter hungaricus TaxID=545624 RepID=A0ABV7WKB9_9MICO